jgi:hypothetical protein
MIHTDGKRTIANAPASRLQAPRIGAPEAKPADDLTPLERVIAEAEAATREAAKEGR